MIHRHRTLIWSIWTDPRVDPPVRVRVLDENNVMIVTARAYNERAALEQAAEALAAFLAQER